MSTELLRPAEASTSGMRGGMNSRIVWRSAISGLILTLGSLATGVVAMRLGQAVGQLVGDAVGRIVGAVLILLGLGMVGALWVRVLTRVAKVPHTRRLLIATAVVNALGTIALVMVLGALEEDLVENGHTTLAVHNLYTLLFVSAALISGAVMGTIVGLCVGGAQMALRLMWRGAFASAIAYLILNVLQDVLGRRVGGPNAGETATMITVTLVCNIGSAMALSVALVRGLQTAEVK
jgi:hypothetical protein